jgi:hypothetical protein
MLPQWAPSAAQVVGLQQVFVARQTSPIGHPPQSMLMLVQLSVFTPQSLAEQVGGVHAPHCPFLSQLWPLGQVPQSIMVPQPLPTLPHWRPSSAQVFGLQH